MKRVLVTGSNGFIGTHVCKYLLSKQYYVIGLDIAGNSRHEYVSEYIPWMLSENIHEDFLNGRDIFAVVHLAADMRHEPDEIEVVLHNCTGEQHLLELCEKNNVQVFVQLSSLPVIGTPIEHPITESHPIKPPTVYHGTKRMMEILADYAHYMHGLRTVSYRICAPVGTGMNQNTIFPTFVRKALAGEDLVIYGEGTREQTYIHVIDIARAIESAIESERAQGVYNLASYNRLSNIELAKKIVEVTKSPSKIIKNGKTDPLDGIVWDISIEKLKADTGFEPVISIESAISEQVEFIKGKNNE